jgi:DNA-binding NarL/FixJ family response regulator
LEVSQFVHEDPLALKAADTAAPAGRRGRGCEAVILFVTPRPAALAFVIQHGQQLLPQVRVKGVPLDSDRLSRALAATKDCIDIVVLDVADSPDQAVEACRILRQQSVGAPVVALVCCARPTTPRHVRSLLDLGVSGLLDARVEPARLFDAIAACGQDNSLYVSLHDRRWMIEGTHTLHQDAVVGVAQANTLTADQAAMVALVARGLTNREIGQHLHLAPSTVHHRIGELCGQLGLPNRVALAGWAGTNGYLDWSDVAPPMLDGHSIAIDAEGAVTGSIGRTLGGLTAESRRH